MREPPADSTFAVVGEAEVCEQCHSVSRLTNGLCLNCLFRGALDEDDTPSDKETFKEILADVQSRDGDWHIADHEILDEIARGGMGIVYQAREPHSGRIVALKCVLAYQGDSDHVVARFRREAETAAHLEHPNIVPIYQVGETPDGSPFYTMKYAAGGSLLDARRPLLQHPRQSAALMVKVARAVQYAHENGVLHRDLKPGNILLDKHGEPLVSDFGLARCEAVSGHLTRSLASFGTPGYIAPEQADGPIAKLTPAADVYSLGAILFELLCGRIPFVGDNALAIVKRSAQEPAPRLRSLAPQTSRDLEIICDHCLEREPADRYQSAGELADDLQNWLDDRAILARAPSAWLQTRRWIRRNRKLAVSLAILGVVVAGSVFWQLRAQRIQTEMTQTIVAAHAAVILPFLDLDTAKEDPVATEWAARLLNGQFENLGSIRIVRSSAPGWAKLGEIRRMAQEARARTVITGTVRNVDGKRRVSLRVLDPTNGHSLFTTELDQSEHKSRPKAEEWAVQLHTVLSADDWTNLTASDPGERNKEASDDMAAGRACMASYTVSHLDRAIILFQKAIAEQPDSSLAHAYLANAATGRTHFVADLKYLELGKAEARKALDLDPNSAVAHRALSGVYFQEGKFYDALEEGMRTLEIGGAEEKITAFLGMTLDLLGRPDRALGWYEIASKLQENPGELESLIGDSRAKLDEDELAFSAYDRAMELQPASLQGAIGKARLHALRGETDAAREICVKRFRNINELGEMAQVAAQIEFFARNYQAAEELYEKLARGDAHGGGSFYGAITYQSALGRLKQLSGSPETAATLLQDALQRQTAILNRQPSNPEAAYRVAAIEASLNLTDAALLHLHQAVALGWLDRRSLQKDPRFDSLRGNPELGTLIDGLSAKVADLKRNHDTRK